jgi:hypothetical protein
MREHGHRLGQLRSLLRPLRSGASVLRRQVRAIVRWRCHQMWQQLRVAEYRSGQLRRVLERLSERSGLLGGQVRD